MVQLPSNLPPASPESMAPGCDHSSSGVGGAEGIKYFGSHGEVAVHVGNALGELTRVPDASVQTCVTSPPYYGLRDYGCAGQIGLEESLDDYLKRMVAVFDLVLRKLKADGTLWINIGDVYAGGGRGPTGANGIGNQAKRQGFPGNPVRIIPEGFKAKDLILVGAKLMFALQERGWYLRSEIVWDKPNGMPGSQQDRPTVSHEKVYLLSKSRRYKYDSGAVKLPLAGSGARPNEVLGDAAVGKPLRSVWSIPVSRGGGKHFATFPSEIVRRCVLLASSPGDVVLDPFAGTGTTGRVALALGRKTVLVELNPLYISPFLEWCRVKYGVEVERRSA